MRSCSIFILSIFIHIHYLDDRGRSQLERAAQEEPSKAFRRLHTNNQLATTTNIERSIDIVVIHFFFALNGRNIYHIGTIDDNITTTIHWNKRRITGNILYIGNRQVGRNLRNGATAFIESPLRSIVSLFSKISFMRFTIMSLGSRFNILLRIIICTTNAIGAMQNVVIHTNIKRSIHTNRTTHDSISTITTGKIATNIDWAT